MSEGNYPLGEVTWIRRDHPDHGVLFFLREIRIIILIIAFSYLTLDLNLRVIQVFFSNSLFSQWASSFIYFIVILVNIIVARALLLQIYPLAICPLWLYAEQLNPEQLKIYHFRKPPTIIKLAQSSLDTKTRLKHYTTLTITDQATETSATLGLLTPEEYDRFMQYWNAANPPASTKDQE